MISKEDILERTNTYNILEYYTRDVRKGKPLKPQVNFQNPLISRQQRTPSFNISRWNDQYWFKDYKLTEHHGSAFELVMRLYGIDLPTACRKINQDMNLGIEDGGRVKAERKFKPEPVICAEEDRNYDFRVWFRQWEKKIDDSFWGQYGIDRSICRLFGCYPLSSFYAYTKENKPYQIKAKHDDSLYFFQRLGWGMVYRPKVNPQYVSKNYTLGKKPKGYLFGLEQLPQSGKRLFITGGKKDVMSLRAHGYYSVTLNSETSDPGNYPDFFTLINSPRFEEYIFLYDNDEIGIKMMEKNVLRFANCKYMVVPEMPDDDKDVSDWFKLFHSKAIA